MRSKIAALALGVTLLLLLVTAFHSATADASSLESQPICFELSSEEMGPGPPLEMALSMSYGIIAEAPYLVTNLVTFDSQWLAEELESYTNSPGTYYWTNWDTTLSSQSYFLNNSPRVSANERTSTTPAQRLAASSRISLVDVADQTPAYLRMVWEKDFSQRTRAVI